MISKQFQPSPTCIKCGQTNKPGQLICSDCRRVLAKEKYASNAISKKRELLKGGCCKKCGGKAALVFLTSDPLQKTLEELRKTPIMCVNCLISQFK